ncbi:MAG: hypothetical protein R3D01_02200 [Hyphomicrobiales bacterium]
MFYLWRRAGRRVATEKISPSGQASFATQSGPMLVIDGAIHPAFIVKSKDLKPRRRRWRVQPDGGPFRHQPG